MPAKLKAATALVGGALTGSLAARAEQSGRI